MLKQRVLAAIMATLLLCAWSLPVGAMPKDGLILARVDVLAPRADLGLPVYAFLQDASGQPYVLTAAPLSRLAASGLGFQVLDTGARPGGYLLALERRAGARALAAACCDVLHDDGQHIVLKAEPGLETTLAGMGFDLERLSEIPMVFREPQRTPIPAAGQGGDQLVTEMLAQVSQTTITQYTGDLSGEWPVLIGGEWYTIETRYTDSGAPIQKATQYAHDHLESLGIPASYHTWSMSGHSGRNVIGVMTGATHADEIVLVVGHIDSIAYGSSMTNAPGADDNASGSVGVMVAADIFSRYAFERTIRFVFFTGEEQGLLGSTRYAQAVAAAGDNIVAVYNMDMLAWDGDAWPYLDLHTRSASNPAYVDDMVIAETFVDVVDYHNLDLLPVIRNSNVSASDHSPFWTQGYPAILAIEDYTGGDFNPYYHSANDLLEHLNMDYYTEFVKASVGTVARLAGPGRITPFVISKTPSAEVVAAGTPLTYTLRVTNTARATATGLVVTDTIPADTTFLWAGQGGALENGAVAWQPGALASGAWLTLTYAVQVGCVPTGTAIVNDSYAVSASEWPAAIAGDPVTVTTTAVAPVAEFTFTAPAVRDHPVAFTNLSQHAMTYTWTFGDGSGTAAMHPAHVYTATGAYTVTLTAAHACDSDTASQALTVKDYAVLMTPATTQADTTPGAQVAYTLAITNAGNLTDTFTLEIAGATWTTTLSAPTIGPLAPGAGEPATVSVILPPDAIPGTVDVIAVTATSLGDPRAIPATVSTTLTTMAADYGVQLMTPVAEAAGAPATIVRYTVRLTNTGTLPDTFVLTATGAAWPTTVPALPIGPLASGAAVDVDVTVAVPSGAASDASDTVTVRATSQRDPRTPQATATATLTTRVMVYQIHLPLILAMP